MVKQAATAEEAVASDQPAPDGGRSSGGTAAGSGAPESGLEPAATMEPGETAPIESRFLYVDVAAQRAKQLRRGALPRLDDVPAPAFDDPHSPGQKLKLERVAMREVDAGKIVYEVPTDDQPAKAE